MTYLNRGIPGSGKVPAKARTLMPEQKSKIVVVDDDAGMNQAIRRLLDAADFRVVTFASGEALLDGSAAAGAACVIFDVHLPGISGFELYERLKGRGVEVPVIFVTAYDTPAAREQAEKAGAVAYLTKPFVGRTLLDKVCHALRPAAANGDVPES